MVTVAALRKRLNLARYGVWVGASAFLLGAKILVMEPLTLKDLDVSAILRGGVISFHDITLHTLTLHFLSGGVLGGSSKTLQTLLSYANGKLTRFCLGFGPTLVVFGALTPWPLISVAGVAIAFRGASRCGHLRHSRGGFQAMTIAVSLSLAMQGAPLICRYYTMMARRLELTAREGL